MRKWNEDQITESGVVEGKDWNAIVAGACGFGIILIGIVAYFL